MSGETGIVVEAFREDIQRGGHCAGRQWAIGDVGLFVTFDCRITQPAGLHVLAPWIHSLSGPGRSCWNTCCAQ